MNPLRISGSIAAGVGISEASKGVWGWAEMNPVTVFICFVLCFLLYVFSPLTED